VIQNEFYATVDATPPVRGIYRSDDAGETWRLMNTDARLWGRGGDFAELKVHPRIPTFCMCKIASYRSDDGGKNIQWNSPGSRRK
jgi:hypothetical protein